MYLEDIHIVRMKERIPSTQIGFAGTLASGRFGDDNKNERKRHLFLKYFYKLIR